MSKQLVNQHTLKREVWCEGVGLHSGSKVSMRLKPASSNFGIRFRRLDICGHPTIAAHYRYVVDTHLATSIGFDGVVVSTIEHLMAALVGSRVDNVLIELDAPEVPIFDGSAAPYLEALQEAGLRKQNAPRKCLSLVRPLLVKEGDAYIKATPSDHFRVRYSIDFPHPLVGKQEFSWAFDETRFDRDIAKARTFGFLKDVQHLQKMGLARGGSLANVMVFDDSRLLNLEGFRYSNECVRHKVLDFMGDLALAGMPLLGSFEVHKAGHALHNRFVRQLMSEVDSFAVSTEPYIPPVYFRPAATAIPGFAEPFSAAAKPI